MLSKVRLIGLLVFLPVFSYAQVLDYLDIRLSVREKVDDTTRALPYAKLEISDEGKVETNGQGYYDFIYPVRNNVDPEIFVSLISDEHKMLKPLDGSVVIDPEKEELAIEFLVINMAEESPEFKKKIRDLEKKMIGLQAKDALTTRQLNALNAKLVDTLLYFETNRKRLESEVRMLNEELGASKEENEAMRQQIDGLNAKIVDLEGENEILTEKLTVALEKRYLRQNQYFKDISSDLNEYLQRLKDLRDLLPFIKEYFKLEGDLAANYNSTLNRYNAIYTKINTQHQGYLEGTENYWERPSLSKDLEKVYKYLLNALHQGQVKGLVQDLNNEIRKQRPNKAQKLATDNYEDLVVNIKKLEKDTNRILTHLRRNL